jgi:hypothetical protein
METGRQSRSCLGIGPSVRGKDIRKGCRRVNMVEYYALMFAYGKMRPVETVPGMGEENDRGVNSSVRYGKNFGKCHSVPPAQQLYGNNKKGIKKIIKKIELLIN